MQSTGPHTRLFYGWVIVATLFVINFSWHATAVFGFGLFVIPMSADLGVSRGVIGWAQTMRQLSGGLSSFILGRWLDRYGARYLLAAAAGVTGIGLALVGLAQQVWQVLLLFTLVGLAGLSQPGSLLTTVPIAKWFVRRRGRAIALATVGFAGGGTVLVPVTQMLIAAYGWRATWAILGAVTIAVMVPLSLLFLRRQPEDMGLVPDGDVAPPEERQAKTAPQPEPAWTARGALRTGTLWKLCASFALFSFSGGGLGLHRIPYWVERGFDPQTVSYSYSVDAVAFGCMALLAGVLADRFPVRFVAAGSILSHASAVTLMLVGTGPAYLFGSAILFGVGAGTNVVVQTHIWAAYYGRASLGTIRGIVFPAVLLGGGLGPPAIGYIYDIAGSYTLAWWMMLGILLSAAAITVSAAPPRAPAPPSPAVAAAAGERS